MRKYIFYLVILLTATFVVERYIAFENAKKIFNWNLISIDSKGSKIRPEFRDLLPGQNLKNFDVKFSKCNFKIPSDTLKYEFKKDSSVKVIFSDSSSIIIVKGTGFDIYNYMDSDPQYRITKPYFANLGIKSNTFSLFKTLHNYSPEEISFFDSRKDLEIKYAIISMKNIVLPMSGNEHLYEFKNQKIRGFQYGKPEEMKHVFVLLFLDEVESYFFILEKVSQNRIDYLLSQIK